MAKREAGNGRVSGRKAAKKPTSGGPRKAAGASAPPGKRRGAGAAKAARKAAPRSARTSGAAKGAGGARTRASSAASRRPATGRPASAHKGGVAQGGLRPAPPGAALSDEEQILAAKYLPRELPPRLFEEERFLFPESYNVNRVRLLVKDPDWIFAYWDVDPKSLDEIGRSVGERVMALSRLSLRVFDPKHGGSTDILLPSGARWWYVRTDSAARSYRAELGVILPSGEFRRLAESNLVTTPRVGPSSALARRRVAFRGVPVEAGDVLAAGEARPDAAAATGPWTAPPFDAAAAPRPGRGGASDAFRPGGASDVHRR
jgi:hypothetical protein